MSHVVDTYVHAYEYLNRSTSITNLHRILCNIIVGTRLKELGHYLDICLPSHKCLLSDLSYTYILLTYLVFRAHHNKSKSCQRENKRKICQNVEEVDPHPKILPLVMQETANQWMFQKIKTTTVNL